VPPCFSRTFAGTISIPATTSSVTLAPSVWAAFSSSPDYCRSVPPLVFTSSGSAFPVPTPLASPTVAALLTPAAFSYPGSPQSVDSAVRSA
jgi:hypothetical protein